MEREVVMSGVNAAQRPRALGSIGVTVCGLKPETEGDLIGSEQWKGIHEGRASVGRHSQVPEPQTLDDAASAHKLSKGSLLVHLATLCEETTSAPQWRLPVRRRRWPRTAAHC